MLELHTHHDFGCQGIPLHATFAGESLFGIASSDLVYCQLILPDGDLVAFQVLCLQRGGCRIVDFHHIGALEILLRKAVGQGEIYHVVFTLENDRGVVKTDGLHAQHQIVTCFYELLKFLPVDGVFPLLAGDATGEDGLRRQGFFLVRTFAVIEELDLVLEL